ncbi:unnamed protein product [Plutella xylostella]|uniref:(diamondback moth) hypothetical protein n=1 Tax=Plutella xylostella TaxID=51655 RepID=A0A8S4F414_PLUXY|nr:unnamed protein product [Plutella xylostella]
MFAEHPAIAAAAAPVLVVLVVVFLESPRSPSSYMRNEAECDKDGGGVSERDAPLAAARRRRRRGARAEQPE